MRKSWFYTGVVLAIVGLSAWGGSLAVVFGSDTNNGATSSKAYREISDSYSKTDVDTRLARVVTGNTALDLSNFATKATTYTKDEIDAKISTSETGSGSGGVTDSYTKAEADGKFALKTEIPSLTNYVTTTSADEKYRTITDSYTKTEIDTKIAAIPTTGGGTTTGTSNADAYLVPVTPDGKPTNTLDDSNYLTTNTALSRLLSNQDLSAIPPDALATKSLVERILQNAIPVNLKNSSLANNLGINGQLDEIRTVDINFNTDEATDASTLYLGGLNLGITFEESVYTNRATPANDGGDYFKQSSRDNSFLFHYDIVGLTIVNKRNAGEYFQIPIISQNDNWNNRYCRSATRTTPQISTFDNSNARMSADFISNQGFLLKARCEKEDGITSGSRNKLRLYIESEVTANNTPAYLDDYTLRFSIIAK